jgi:predicted transcriptional regulator
MGRYTNVTTRSAQAETASAPYAPLKHSFSLPAMSAGKPLSEDQNAKIRGIVRELVRELGSQVAVARALGVTQGALSQFLLGKTGAGINLATRVAMQKHVSLANLLDDPRFAFAGHAEQVTLTGLLVQLLDTAEAAYEKTKRESDRERVDDVRALLEKEAQRAEQEHASLRERIRELAALRDRAKKT